MASPEASGSSVASWLASRLLTYSATSESSAASSFTPRSQALARSGRSPKSSGASISRSSWDSRAYVAFGHGGWATYAGTAAHSDKHGTPIVPRESDSTPTMPVGPSYVEGSNPSWSPSSTVELLVDTGIGRVCGTSASRAQSRWTRVTFADVSAEESRAANWRHRMFGSGP